MSINHVAFAKMYLVSSNSLHPTPKKDFIKKGAELPSYIFYSRIKSFRGFKFLTLEFILEGMSSFTKGGFAPERPLVNSAVSYYS